MADSNLDAMRAELKAMRQELNDLREMGSTCVTAPPVVVGSPDGSGGAAVDDDNDLREGSPDGSGGAAVDVDVLKLGRSGGGRRIEVRQRGEDRIQER